MTRSSTVAGVFVALLASTGQAIAQAPSQSTPAGPTPTAIPPASTIPMPVPMPLPLPGQLKVLGIPPAPPQPHDPQARIGVANMVARVQPERSGWLNAIQVYPYADGALYQVYASPGQVTDITLQEAEELVGPGPIASGDTVRWIIGDTVSGQGQAKRVHILVKPTRPDLVTNLVINTDRRTYHLELRATPSTYMAAVSWSYPQDQLIALRKTAAAAERAAPAASGLEVAALDFRYRIDGDAAPWRPVRAFDDGRQAYIEFPETVATSEMPPLFVLGPDAKAELVNYRVRGRYMIVDRLFDTAELRLGTGKSQTRVTVRRGEAARRPS